MYLAAWQQLVNSPVALVFLVLVVVLVFGANKLPMLARNVGQSLRILKSEVRTLQDDEKAEGSTAVEGKVVDGNKSDQAK